jgi:hypothetical protein
MRIAGAKIARAPRGFAFDARGALCVAVVCV